MIITCPNCQTRYKVATTALSAAGRQVQCAACSTSWVATPSFPQPDTPPSDPDPDDDELAFRGDRDTLFSPDDEKMLDTAFAREEADEVAKADLVAASDAQQVLVEDTNAIQKRVMSLDRRKRAVLRALPREKLRRTARILIWLALLGLITGAIAFRTNIVRTIPALDGLYRAVGLGTNVVGLDFVDLKTLRTTRDGQDVIVVTAKIINAVERVVFVPMVLVSLLDDENAVIYEWTVTPAARNILPGDVLGVDTQLIAPPQGVDRVRLTFVTAPSATGATL